MIDQSLRESLQTYYSSFLSSTQFRARYGQRLMIAELARRLAVDPDAFEQSPIALVEAGTGTGKTVAYALTGFAVAAAQDKTLVISTATVALQEQLVLRDLGEIQKHAGIEFSYALAKGRRRYLCVSKLDAQLQGSDQTTAMTDFFPDELAASRPEDLGQLQLMLETFGAGRWDGDRDSLAFAVDDRTWRGVSTDRQQCTNRQCSFFSQCPFFTARERLDEVDVIVTNHDLLLADLASDESQILPAPEETLYVIDEAHHLADKARGQWAGFLASTSHRELLAQLEDCYEQTKSRLIDASLDELVSELAVQTKLPAAAANGLQTFDQVVLLLRGFEDEATAQGDAFQHRFVGGEIDDALAAECLNLAGLTERLEQMMQSARQTLEQAIPGADAAQRVVLESLVTVFGTFVGRLGSAANLWRLFGAADEQQGPSARWLDFTPDELLVHCTPIRVDTLLYEKLWSQCAGAVLTSATLAVGRDFSMLTESLGLPEDVVGVVVPSPFDYSAQGQLRIPRMSASPTDAAAHTEELSHLIPQLLVEFQSGLVLFTSWRQFFAVVDGLSTQLRDLCLLQGEDSKAEMLRKHRERIDAGEQSYLLGLASFAEGVDLPGDYCLQVIIAKIPFSVPDDPVGATQQEWIEASGGNSFTDFMLPNAALRLTQAAGRLLRTESDQGVVTLLDDRLRTKFYGPRLRSALPPFRDYEAPPALSDLDHG